MPIYCYTHTPALLEPSPSNMDYKDWIIVFCLLYALDTTGGHVLRVRELAKRQGELEAFFESRCPQVCDGKLVSELLFQHCKCAQSKGIFRFGKRGQSTINISAKLTTFLDELQRGKYKPVYIGNTEVQTTNSYWNYE